MNELFEEFVAEFISRELRDFCRQQGLLIRPQSSTKALLWCTHSKKKQFWLKPDIRFETEARETELILDTKWKVLDEQARRGGVAEADAYQMFAYAHRYNCPRVVLLYPESGTPLCRRLSSERDAQTWLEVRTLNLMRDFSNSSERNELKAAIKEILMKQVNA